MFPSIMDCRFRSKLNTLSLNIREFTPDYDSSAAAAHAEMHEKVNASVHLQISGGTYSD